MRPRNKALHDEVNRVVDLKLRIPAAKTIAARHHVKEQWVRKLISDALKRHKAMNVVIHVEQEAATLTR